ncbi:hypothetical protein [Nocardioides rubriscoriae]|uniref:hypothetical protein n=1 Tax=Nocardioides rubriscoriae TaxID=642762 RepID=UPI0011E04FAD|nr:hypothetical protein [Nocardioides rubriscoriae]
MPRRGVAVVLAGTVVSALLTGCGGGSDDPQPGPVPGSSGSSSASSVPTATDSAGAGDPAAYLPVPDGVELTAPGTELAFREAALAAWKPRQDLVGVVGVTVLKVQRTTVKKSLPGFDLDPVAAASTPYFVSTQVGNGGDTDLGGRQLPLYVVDSDGRLIPPTGIDQAFEPCPGSALPAIFAPGDEARSCLIFLVPKGAKLVSVMFRPPEGVVPITWSGKVEVVGRSSGAKDKKDKKDKRDSG